MRPIDVAVFFAYLGGVLALGLVVRRRDRSNDEYFLARRSMPSLVVGLSVMATAFSAINYTAFPTEVFQYGLYVAVSVPVFVLVAFPITRWVMPFYHPMGLTSAYEYLERRFDVRVRCLGSGLFILWRVFWMATALYATGRVLAAVTGLEVWLLILLAGVVATAYTAAGGMRAVMWTDVAQFAVLFAGIVAGVLVAVGRSPGGLAGVFQSAAEGGRLQPVAPFDPAFLSPDPRVRISLWSGLIGTLVAFLGRYGADQVIVQRYFAARSLRAAQRGFWLNVAAAVVSLVLLGLLGLAVYAHAGSGGAAQAGQPPIAHLARLIRSMPAALTGLLAAGLLAATMSSVDSGINACSAAYVVDFHERFLARRRSVCGTSALAGARQTLRGGGIPLPTGERDPAAPSPSPLRGEGRVRGGADRSEGVQPSPPPSPCKGEGGSLHLHPLPGRERGHGGGCGTPQSSRGAAATGARPLLTVGFGALAVALAFVVGRAGSLFEIANKVVNGLGSPLLGLMLVGALSRRANPAGTLAGGLVGTALSLALTFGVSGLALHYYAVVNLAVTVAACLLLSGVARRLGASTSTAGQLAWTWRERRSHGETEVIG